jgi:hypothetical protein
MKALAAATARPAPVPSLNARAPELSGMVGRRGSVVGARIDDRAPIVAGLSGIWVAAGCAAVLLPGLTGVWLLGKASASSSSSSAAMVPPVAVAPAPERIAAVPPSPVEIEPLGHLPAMMPDTDVVAPAPAPGYRGAPRYFRHRRGDARRAALAAAAAAAAGGAPAAPATPGAPAPAGAAAASADEAPADSPDPSDKADKAEKAEKAEKADDGEKPADKPKKVVAEAAPEEPSTAPPRTLRELRSALARLQMRVGQCHQRFQIDGVADVKVAVNPSGTVESASLAGEFEGTPTGDCIVRLVSAASFPAFDGTESVHVSHSFSLE